MNSAPAHAKPTKVGWALRVLLPLGALLAFWGYVGPWVDHRVAGLAILGLDLGEYVKFLPLVRARDDEPVAGGVLPAAGRDQPGVEPLYLAAGTTLAAARGRMADDRIAGIGAIVAALNMLPPAWTPQRMLTPEFQQQLAAILLCLAAVAFGPFLALLPRLVTGVIVILLSTAAAVVPVMQFFRVLPEIATLYNHNLVPGWGMYLMLIGLAMLAVLGGLLAFARTAPAGGRPASAIAVGNKA